MRSNLHYDDNITYIKHINIDGLYICDEIEEHCEAIYIKAQRNIGSLNIKNVIIDRLDSMKKAGVFIEISNDIEIKDFVLENVQCDNIGDIVIK